MLKVIVVILVLTGCAAPKPEPPELLGLGEQPQPRAGAKAQENLDATSSLPAEPWARAISAQFFSEAQPVPEPVDPLETIVPCFTFRATPLQEIADWIHKETGTKIRLNIQAGGLIGRQPPDALPEFHRPPPYSATLFAIVLL